MYLYVKVDENNVICNPYWKTPSAANMSQTYPYLSLRRGSKPGNPARRGPPRGVMVKVGEIDKCTVERTQRLVTVSHYTQS